jgi:hypothetical protein
LRVEANSTFGGRPDVEAREPVGESDRDAMTGDEMDESEQTPADKKKTGPKKELKGESGDEESPTLKTDESGSKDGKKNDKGSTGDKTEKPAGDDKAKKSSGD